jgi:hypothetical protein
MNELKKRTLLPIPSKSPARRQIRRKKIVDIRRQLARGKYDVNKRLNVVLDRILEDIIHRRKGR